MARYRDDDNNDRDDDRPRRRRYDNDPPKKSNTGMVLLIVGLAVGIPLLVCAGVVVYVVTQVKKGFNEIVSTAQANVAGQQFLSSLELGNVRGAYDSTTPNFRANTTFDQFDRLVKANPALTSSHTATQSGFPAPAGTAPSRTVSITFTISPTQYGNTGRDPWATPTSRKGPGDPGAPVNPPPTAPTQGLSCTIRLVEQADNTWKVDGFTVP
jgi:hypothetical protein